MFLLLLFLFFFYFTFLKNTKIIYTIQILKKTYLLSSQSHYLRLAGASFCLFLTLLFHFFIIRTVVNFPFFLRVFICKIIIFWTGVSFGFLWFWFRFIFTRRILSGFSWFRFFFVWWSVSPFFYFLGLFIGTRIFLWFSRSWSIIFVSASFRFLLFLTRRRISPRSFWFF